MRTLWLISLLLLLPLQIYAVDLFGNEKLDEGEISIAEQTELYQLFFGKADSEASSPSKKLKLALQLQQDYSNEKFAALQRYMLIRITDLITDSKKKEAIDLQVFVFTERYKKRDSNHFDNRALVNLLEIQLKKAHEEHRASMVNEIIALLNDNVQFSLKDRNYQQAIDDLESVSTWQEKIGDKESAKISKDLGDYIEDYIDEKENVTKLIEALKSNPSDAKNNASVGRFYVKESNWSSALPYLQDGQETELAGIAAIAQEEEQTLEKKVACVIAIAEALLGQNNKKDVAIKRALLKLGASYRSDLNDQKDKLSTPHQVKFDMVSAGFEEELAQLGPDPLTDFSFATGGGSVDESRMLRNGWEMIFDHENNTLTRSTFINTEAASAEVKNGMLIIKTTAGNSVGLSNIPNQNTYKGIHIRFKYITQPAGKFTLKVPGMNGQIVWVYFYQDAKKVTQAGFTTGYTHSYSPAFGSLPLNVNDWNELRMIWDGKTAVGSINGVEFDKSPARPSPDAEIINFSVGGDEDCEVHIQSFLALKR